MRLSRMMTLLSMLGAFTAGCSEDGKDGCVTQADCLEGRLCNYDQEAQVGQCMDATPDGFFMCTRANPCPAGQFCFNGLCAPGCMTDQDCAANQYCDTAMEISAHMCVNRVVPTCAADADCATNQTCVFRLCSAVGVPSECTQRVDGEDGCDAYSICLDVSETDQESLACVSFPPCPADGVCPVGQVGSVCNDGDLPGKAHICLTHLCKAGNNCPGGFQCVVSGGTLGMCSDGSLGMPCLLAADCDAGLTCMGAMAGVLGFCMPGGGSDCASAEGTCIDMTGECPAGTDVDGARSCPNMTQLCCL